MIQFTAELKLKNPIKCHTSEIMFKLNIIFPFKYLSMKEKHKYLFSEFIVKKFIINLSEKSDKELKKYGTNADKIEAKINIHISIYDLKNT